MLSCNISKLLGKLSSKIYAAALLSCRSWDQVGTKVAAVGTCASRGVKLHQNYNPE